MSKEQETQVSFRDYVIIHRNQIIVAYDNAKELALKSFDDLAKRLDEQYKLNETLKSAENKTPKVEEDKPKTQNK